MAVIDATKSMGKFISFEGIDGAGKSSHIAWFADELIKHGRSLIVSREPGGTAVGERLRDIILNDKMEAATEALLVFAARQEHVLRVIIPALENGDWILCDRFTDATFAYQGYGRGFPLAKLETLESWVQADLTPDLTIIFDCDPEVAALRLAASRDADKFESESLEFFIRVRNGYLARAAQHPERYAIVNSTESMEGVRAQLMPLIAALLPR
jgi:dTMP kinase